MLQLVLIQVGVQAGSLVACCWGCKFGQVRLKVTGADSGAEAVGSVIGCRLGCRFRQLVLIQVGDGQVDRGEADCDVAGVVE